MNFTIKKTCLPWLWLSLLIIILDQITKFMVLRHVPFGEFITITPFLNLVMLHNPGAAFSFLAKESGWQNGVFIGTAIVISCLLIWWLYKMPRKKVLLPAALALVVGGALGNLLDRISHGFVIDFLDFHIGTLHWYAFNLADSAIVIGVIILVINSLWPKKSKASRM